MSQLKQVLRTLLGRTILRRNVLLPVTRGRRFVFTYHDISEPARAHYHPVYSTPPGDFHRQIKQLSDLFTLVALPDLVAAQPEDRRHLAAIVFDDGFASVLEFARPYLFALGIPFTVFVNRQAIEEDRLWCSDVVLGGRDRPYLARLYERYVHPQSVAFDVFARNPLDYLVVSDRLADDYSDFYARPRPASRVYLNKQEIKTLASEGVTVGSHTANHKVLSKCSDEALIEEIAGNRHYLEALLDEPIEHFAFPFGFEGMLDQRSASMARSLHAYLYSTQRLSFRSKGTPPFPIPRIGLTSDSAGELMTSINLPFFSKQSPGFPGVSEDAPRPALLQPRKA